MEKYPSTVYVPPVKSKVFYKDLNVDKQFDLEQIQNIVRRYLDQIDLYYDETEYLQLNNNIIEAINNNYLITESMIGIDSDLYHFSSNIELENQALRNDSDDINFSIDKIEFDILAEYIKENGQTELR